MLLNCRFGGGIYIVVGFVLIHVSPKSEYKVYNELSRVLEVTELHTLFGGYDLVAKIEAEDYEKLGDIVLNNIRTIEGVIDTMTLMGTKFR